MRFQLLSVRDTVADTFKPPSTFVNEAVGIRAFTDMMNEEDSIEHVHPEDYNLYKLAEFDDETGIIYPTTEPELLMLGINARTPE